MLYAQPRRLDVGEAALSVEFGDAVDPAEHARVLALDAALRASRLCGVEETVPTYRALTIHYDPLTLDREKLLAALEAMETQGAAPAARRRWRVPCCYDPTLAEDILQAAALLAVSPERLAALHAGGDYRAYMYGFAPGWCYLGGLPQPLKLQRRASPRGPTPQGAVLIGGGLSLIGVNPMPTGWYVIGRTPENLFALNRDPPLLIEPGDAVSFELIDAETFAALSERAARGEVVLRKEIAS